MPVTLDRSPIAFEKPSPPRDTTPGWTWPFLLAAPLLVWYERFRVALPSLGTVTKASTLPLAALGVLVFAAMVAAEALAYRVLWRARGARLPFRATALAVLQLSMLESIALVLIDRAQPGTRASLAWLVGPRALATHAGAFGSAFGSAGALTALRIGLFAYWQSDMLARRWREALALVGGAWLATHLALAWLVALAAGFSVR